MHIMKAEFNSFSMQCAQIKILEMQIVGQARMLHDNSTAHQFNENAHAIDNSVPVSPNFNPELNEEMRGKF